MPPILTEIDQLIRSDHSYLSGEDRCWFLREYTSGEGYEYGETNQLILNFKKSVDRRQKAEWRYKERAILQISNELRGALSEDWLRSATLVPIPPSKTHGHPDYDDRMERTLANVYSDLDIRCLIRQLADRDPVHRAEERPLPHEIADNYEIDESRTEPAPECIALFDDVMTTGSHYRAAKQILGDRFPKATIYGIFIARRVFRSAASQLDP